MKVLLTVFSVLSIVFVGGCGLILGGLGVGAGGLLVLVAALNVLLLMAIWGPYPGMLPLVYVFGAADLCGAVATLVFAGQDMAGYSIFPAAILALKGVLSILVTNEMRKKV